MPLTDKPACATCRQVARSRSGLLRRLLAWGLVAGVFGLALGVIYWPLVAGRVLAGGDLQLYFFPHWVRMTQAFHQKASVLWNPYLFGGAPLLANSQVGALYPLNWPFWLLSAPELDAVTRAVHGSVLLHLLLAASSAGLLVWAVLAQTAAAGDRDAPWLSRIVGAGFAALVYAGSGFLGSHLEHLNQLQALAWLPLCFLPGRPAPALKGRAGMPVRTRVVSIVAFAMILLAGHIQMAFIAAVGLVVWHGVGAAQSEGALTLSRARAGKAWRRAGLALWRAVGRLAPFVLAGVLAGVQLLPSMQLAALSGRSGTYGWRDAVSFSVTPWQLPRVLLPSYIVSPLLPEGVAYTGLVALLLAGVGVWVWRKASWRPAALVLVGLFLALGGYNPFYLVAVRIGVPGFAHFRAPARFLGLLVLGVAVLGGLGVAAVAGMRKRALGLASVVMATLALAAELWLGGAALPYGKATARRAYTDLRPATAFLVAAARAAGETGDMAGHRFISISQTLFEVGDKQEIATIYEDRLPPDAVLAYLVAAKQREVLAPNLPLAFGVPAADGYDGGLLPLRTYTAFSRLLLPDGTSDGRLRENLTGVPEQRWLELLGVRYLLTDKTGDVWLQDILYDRQFRPLLAKGESLNLAWLPDRFAANGVRLLYTGEGEVVLELADGRVVRSPLPFSQDPDIPQHVEWEGAVPVVRLEIHAADSALALSGASLVDDRLGTFYPLVLSDALRLVHSGDVKIYELLTPPERAFLVHEAQFVSSVDTAIDLMAVSGFDPADRVVLISAPGAVERDEAPPTGGVAAGGNEEQVHVVQYDPTQVVIDVDVAAPGYLILTDAWYPGWSAHIAPQPSDAEGVAAVAAPILQADVLFRAVPLSPGRWRVVLRYAPLNIVVGAGTSLLGGIGLLAYEFAVLRHRRTLVMPN